VPSHCDRERDAEIARFGVLGKEQHRDLQALVELTAQVCDVPSAVVNLITTQAQHQVAAVGFEPAVCAREDSMCAQVVDEPDSVVVDDAVTDPLFHDNPFVTGEVAHVRFYASAPLLTRRGVPIGRLCVFDTAPRELSQRQTRALTMLADRVVDVLELRLRGNELGRSLEELTRTRDELHRSNKRLSYFAGHVSHDLRTPLTAMILNTEAALLETSVAEDPQVSGLLQASLDAGRRMSELIDEILAFARVGAELRMLEVDMQEVAEKALQDIGPALRERQGTADVGRLPSVVGDPHQLYSVLLNLLSNAVKFARPGVRPRVRVQAVRLDERWRFEVVDNGTGVRDGERAKLFLPFARGETEEPGTGIGLATAKRIIEMHGGRIGLGSAPDSAGTVAWFELPD
jgi:signal transduction histidine kinase